MGGTISPETIFNVTTADFNDLALEIFRFQAEHNKVYSSFIQYLNINPAKVEKVEQIPFLPAEVFKNHKVVSFEGEADVIFESSGTTGMQPSRHYVKDASIYQTSLLQGFRHFFGSPEDYVFLALLPSYLERQNSSLVYMTDCLMRESKTGEGGYFLYSLLELAERLYHLKKKYKRKIFLLGVGFALLDFAEANIMDLSHCIVMETGGMKGRRKELIREELHESLCMAFNKGSIYSEYGMTELLSQAYSLEDGRFRTPPWMKVLCRDVNDPFDLVPTGQNGGINIIDLANLYSCSFIATQDLGRLDKDGSFEVLGRFDQADIRGCSLLYE